MSEESKSKEQLQQEVEQLRQRVAELEAQVEQSEDAGKANLNLFKDIAQGVVFQDKDGNITSANPAAQRILGLSLDQMQGRKSFDPPWRAIQEDGTDFPEEKHPATVAIATGKSVHNVVMGVHNPLLGELRWINVNAIQQLRKGNHSTRQVFTTFDDITERKRVDEALRESEQRFALFMEHFPGVAYINSSNETTVFGNRRICEFYGCAPDEYVGKKYEELAGPELAVRLAEQDRKVLSEGTPIQIEEIFPDSLEATHWLTQKFPIPGKDGTSLIGGFSIDITERKRSEEALRESEEKYRNLFEMESDAHFLIDNESGNIVEANAAAVALYGYSRGELLRMQNVDLSDQPEETRKATVEKADMIPVRHHRKKDGTVFPVEITATNSTWHGRPAHMPAIRDITERRLAEEELRESESQHRQAQQVAHIGHWELDSYDSTPTWSDEIFRIFGIDPQVGEPSFTAHDTIIHPEDFPVLGQAIVSGFEQGKPFDLIFKILRPGGEIGWMQSIGEPETDDEGTVVKMFGTAQDVTELKQANEALRESQKILAKGQEIGRVGSWKLVPGTAEVQGSDQLLEIFGLGCKKLTLEAFLEAVHPEDRDYDLEHIQRGLDEGVAWDIEHRLLFGDGTIKWIRAIGEPVLDEQGKTKLVNGITQDITERRQLDEDKARLQEQFQQSQKMEAVGRLAGGVAHDFNNLLTAILGNSELMAEDMAAGDPLLDGLSEINKAADRATALTQQLLAYSRKQVLQPRVLDLNTTVVDIKKMLRRLIGEDIDLVTVLEPELGRVLADPGQIWQVIMNLAVNARDALPEGGKLSIETANVELDESHANKHLDAKPGPHVMIAVSDSGCGMDKETLDNVFEPFFTTKDKSKGTGLGLSMVYGIIKQSGGHIWASSEPGQGTTFSVYFPLAGEAASVPETKAPERDYRGTETILVVEDEEMVRALAARILRRYGYTVLVAGDGEEAWSIVETHPDSIHMVLTDVVMPGASGKEVATAMTASHPGIKVLFMSGYTDDAIGHHGVLDTGTNFIMKPFMPIGLARTVREVLDG